MKYDKLLKLKSEVDNIKLSYNNLNEKLEDIDERLYVEYNIKDDTKYEEIDKYLNDESKRLRDSADKDSCLYDIIQCMLSIIFDWILLIIHFCINISLPVFMTLMSVNIMWFFLSTRIYEWRKDNNCKKELITIMEKIQNLLNEKLVVEKKIELTKEKYANLSTKYKKLVDKLNSKEYQEYLECVNSYLCYVVNNKDKNEVNINSQLTNNNDYTLHLK